MIVTWFVGLASGFVTWITSLFPVWPLPEWFTGLPAKVSGLLTFSNDMGAWINLSAMAAIATTVLGLIGISFAVKGVLRLVSHIPEIGGAG